MTASRRMSKITDPAEFQAVVDERRQNRMKIIDGLSPDLRACVHDYGWNVVKAFMDLGIQKPNHLRHLVETVLNEFSPTRGASSSQGVTAARGIRPDHPLNQQ